MNVVFVRQTATVFALALAACRPAGLAEAADNATAATRPSQPPRPLEPAVAPEPAELQPVPDEAVYLLKYRFEPDQTVRYEVRSKSTVVMTKGDYTQKAVDKTMTRKHYRVLSVDDANGATLETSIDRVRMTRQIGNSDEQTFDSDDETSNAKGFEEVVKTVGRPLVRLKVQSNGALEELISLTDEDWATGNDQNILVVLPDEAVPVGHEWSEKLKVSVNVTRTLKKPVELLRKYRLESVHGSLARIRMKMAVLTPVTDPMIRAQLIQRTPAGTIDFDLDRGVIVSRSLTSDKTELGIVGDNSSMRAVSALSERIVLPPAVARRPGAAQTRQQ